MILAFGSDHAGYELKQFLVETAQGWGHSVNDFGTHGPDSVDYADFGEPVARAVSSGKKYMSLKQVMPPRSIS